MISIEPPSSDDMITLATGLSTGGLSRFMNRARTAVGLAGQVDVLLAGDRTLRRLNKQFRGKNKATDVLSFPALAAEEGGDARFAGDIAISLETAARQAEAFGHTLRDEVRVLLVHGLLHLHGMDHETDEGEMAGREGELREALGLPVSLIARAEGGGSRAANANATSKAKTGKRLKTRIEAVETTRVMPSVGKTKKTQAVAGRGRL